MTKKTSEFNKGLVIVAVVMVFFGLGFCAAIKSVEDGSIPCQQFQE